MADKLDFFEFLTDIYDFAPEEFREKYKIYWDGIIKQYTNLLLEVFGSGLGLSLDQCPVFDRRVWQKIDTSEIQYKTDIISGYSHKKNANIPIAISGSKFLDFTGIEFYKEEIGKIVKSGNGKIKVTIPNSALGRIGTGDFVSIKRSSTVSPGWVFDPDDNNANWFPEISPVVANIGLLEFLTSGQDDLVVSGTYSGVTKKEYQFKISSVDPDKFQYSDDGGMSWSVEITCDTNLIYITDGISVRFVSIEDHSGTEEWSVEVYPVSYEENSRPWVVSTVVPDGTGLNLIVSLEHPNKLGGNWNSGDPDQYELIIGAKYLCEPNTILFDYSKYLVAMHRHEDLYLANWRNARGFYPKDAVEDGIIVNNYLATPEDLPGHIILDYQIKEVRRVKKITTNPSNTSQAVYQIEPGIAPITSNGDYYPLTAAFCGGRIPVKYLGCGSGNNGEFTGIPVGHDMILVDNPGHTPSPRGSDVGGYALSVISQLSAKEFEFISNLSESIEKGDFFLGTTIDQIEPIEQILNGIMKLKNKFPEQFNAADSEVYCVRKGIDIKSIEIQKYNPGPVPTYSTLVRNVDYTIDPINITVRYISSEVPVGSKTRISYSYVDNITYTLGYPYSFPINETIRVIESIQNYIEEDLDLVEKEVLTVNDDFKISSGFICFNQKPSYESYWAKEVLIEQKRLYRNFGFLVGLNLESSDSYKQTLVGIWKALMFGPARENIRRALYLMLGYPIAFEAGVITKFDQVSGSIEITRPDDIVDSYQFDPTLDPFNQSIRVGASIEKFQELTTGIEVLDKNNKPDFMDDIGEEEIRQFYTQNVTEDDKLKARELLKSNIWLVKIYDTEQFSESTGRTFMNSFLNMVKDPRTTFIVKILRADLLNRVDIQSCTDVAIIESVYSTYGHGEGLHGVQLHGDEYFTASGDEVIYDSPVFFNWLGSFAAHPVGVTSDAYHNTSDNKTYIYDGLAWIEMTVYPRLMNQLDGTFMFKNLGIREKDEFYFVDPFSPNYNGGLPYYVASIDSDRLTLMSDSELIIPIPFPGLILENNPDIKIVAKGSRRL